MFACSVQKVSSLLFFLIYLNPCDFLACRTSRNTLGNISELHSSTYNPILMPVPLKHAITNTLVQNKKLKQVYTMTELSALMDASDIALEAIWTFVLSDPDSCFMCYLLRPSCQELLSCILTLHWLMFWPLGDSGSKKCMVKTLIRAVTVEYTHIYTYIDQVCEIILIHSMTEQAEPNPDERIPRLARAGWAISIQVTGCQLKFDTSFFILLYWKEKAVIHIKCQWW